MHYHYGHNVSGYLPESDENGAWPWDEAVSGLVADLTSELESLDYGEDDERSRHLDGDLQAALAAAERYAAAEVTGQREGFLAYVSDGGRHSLPVAWWVTPCTSDECTAEDDGL